MQSTKMPASTKLVGAFLCATLGLYAFANSELFSKPAPQGNLEKLFSTLKNKSAQVPVMIGQNDNEQTVVILAAPPGTESPDGKKQDQWTLVVIDDLSKGTSSVTATGTHFQPVTNLKQRVIPGALTVSYAIANPDHGQTRPSGCTTHANAIETMEQKFGLVRQAYGLSDNMEVVEIYGVTPGTKDAAGRDIPATFSVLTTNDTGATCLLHMGDNFMVVPGLREQYPKALVPGG